MWEQIRANRIRSALVVGGLGAILVAAGAGAGAALGGLNAALGGAVIALGIWLVMWLTTMSSGDRVLLSIAGAREVPPGSMPQLRNVLEEMTIAAGLDHTPRLYVIDDPAPNAFAAGRKPEQALVAVTTGLLAMLDRDELQGVIAHELGHVKNRDVALMTTAGIMLGAIVLIGEVAMRAMWYGGGYRSRSSNNNGNAVAAVIGVLVLVLAPILAQLFYFALSRKREYLADASAARFTRYPEGLARALEKIGGVATPQADQSKVTAPMYIVRPLRRNEKPAVRRRWFATHPPITERVAILRAMGGGAGYADYERATRAVTGQGMVGARTLAEESGARGLVGGGTVAAAGRTAAAAAPSAAEPATPVQAPTTPPEDPRARRQRVREASDALLFESGYQKRICAACGALIKVPPALVDSLRECPRCQHRL